MDEGKTEKYSKKLRNLINLKKDYDELLSITYSNSGNMNGNVDKVELIVKEKIIKVERKEYHSDPLQVVEYSVSEKDINELIDQIKEYNFPMWKDLPEDSEMFALDAPVRNMIFTYNNDKIGGHQTEWYTIDYDSKIPQDGREALLSFEKTLKEAIKEENKVKEYTEEE